MSSFPVHLDVSLEHRLGSLALDCRFSLTHPWTVLFAPSGGGKSSVLRIIAGLLKPDRARIVSREAVLTDTARGVFVQPHKRGVRMVAQSAALFPHMTVRRNVLYRMSSFASEEAILDLCRIEHLQNKMPSQLSGGERQRVALARAIAANDGGVLLLDEPFTGLEHELQNTLIRDLKSWLTERGTCVLSVTHDISEAFYLGAEVIRLADGKIVQQGPVCEVLAEERQRFLEQLHD